MHADATLIDILRRRATERSARPAYTFLDGSARRELGYADLDRQARVIGAALQNLKAQGQRVLLVYPPGLEFVAGFFGCLYGGCVAVPAYSLHPAIMKRSSQRLQGILQDASPLAAVLTTSRYLAAAQALGVDAPRLTTDELSGTPAENWRHPGLKGRDAAFLQYTSGSTMAPRGIVVSHANLLHNSALIQRAFGHTPASHGVIWLPPYHDMGLIGGVLQALYVGASVTLMSPLDFLRDPLMWLKAISQSRATTSGGPNFAYDLCVDKITPEQRDTLDLSSWEVAFNGSEPVRYETIRRFAEFFGPCGFREEAFYPCYGLAEATLIVTGGAKSAPLRQLRSEQAKRMLVGCGQALGGQELAIVDPESRTRCPPERVGEIWVSGPSVAQGYWKNPVETEKTFRAFIKDTGEGPFLRTGDLGFIRNGELFVTGRLKDLIIIRGRNHYPEDIEETVERCHPALRPGSCAAFSVEEQGLERLVIVAETERKDRPELPEVLAAVRQAVAERHELEVQDVVLLKAGGIPKTSSGKIQRHACRAGFLAKTLR